MVFVIRAIPERSELVTKLTSQLKGFLHYVIWDKEHQGVTYCTCEALRIALSTPASWVALLLDDHILCRDFPSIVSFLCSHTAVEALSLFSIARPKGKVIETYGKLALRLRPKGHLMTVPVYRRYVAERVLSRLLHSLERGSRTDDDGVAAHVIDNQGFRSAVVWPNLTNHIGEKSYLGHSWRVGGKPRISAWFAGDEPLL